VCSTETCDPTLVRLEVHASGAEAVETRAPRQAPPLSAGDVVVDLTHVRGPLETLATSTDGRGSSGANPAAPGAATRGVGRGLAGVSRFRCGPQCRHGLRCVGHVSVHTQRWSAARSRGCTNSDAHARCCEGIKYICRVGIGRVH